MSAPVDDIYTALLAKGINPEGAALVEATFDRAEASMAEASRWADYGTRRLAEAREIERRALVLAWAIVAIEAAAVLGRIWP